MLPERKRFYHESDFLGHCVAGIQDVVRFPPSRSFLLALVGHSEPPLSWNDRRKAIESFAEPAAMSHRARNDDRDRRGGRADRDRERERVREARPARRTLNEFFVDGKGIHREVLQREICKYLGPEAHSRPAMHDVCRCTYEVNSIYH